MSFFGALVRKRVKPPLYLLRSELRVERSEFGAKNPEPPGSLFQPLICLTWDHLKSISDHVARMYDHDILFR